MKKKYTLTEEDMFFYWLGNRLFSTVLRGYLLGHRDALSAARDYLHVDSVKEGVERDACEFLVDVTNIGGRDPRCKLSLKEVFEKWNEVAGWRPTLDQPEE